VRLLRRAVALSIALVAITLLIGACGEGDDDETTTPPATSTVAPGATGPSDLGALPPEFIECMAEQGYEIESSADVHSTPPQVLQQCFGH
jgi:hypothetical protein